MYKRHFVDGSINVTINPKFQLNLTFTNIVLRNSTKFDIIILIIIFNVYYFKIVVIIWM